MSRNKKSRSLKRVTGGVKTGTKERTKLENKQNKARKKALTTTGKVKRQRSVYQKMVDENGTEEKQVPSKKVATPKAENTEGPTAKPVANPVQEAAPKTPPAIEMEEPSDDDLWEQLENPGESNTF